MGSKDHNVKVRKIAIDNKYKLNEYGLFSVKYCNADPKLSGFITLRSQVTPVFNKTVVLVLPLTITDFPLCLMHDHSCHGLVGDS